MFLHLSFRTASGRVTNVIAILYLQLVTAVMPLLLQPTTYHSVWFPCPLPMTQRELKTFTLELS